MTTKIPVELSSTPSIVDNGDATAITIDSSENVTISGDTFINRGTQTSGVIKLGGTTDGAFVDFDGSGLQLNTQRDPNTGTFVNTGKSHASIILKGDSTDSNIRFYTTSSNNTTATERMRINSSGNVGIGITSPTTALEVIGDIKIKEGSAYSNYGLIDVSEAVLTLETYSVNTSSYPANIIFKPAGTERMRIDSSGNVLFGKTSLDTGTLGTEIKTGLVNITNSNAQCITINRLNSNGSLILFQQDNTTEGNISVSGTNVSYNGFTGTHESSGIASDTAIGTVCSTIDELDTYVSGKKEGQVRTDHAKIKVSDIVGDTRVYGVLFNYSETDNKPIIASVGISSVLVTGACKGGDLLESNGDGTAKVQDDDIIRSKTIGKVTIGNSNTDVKLVSCVLYCG